MTRDTTLTKLVSNGLFKEALYLFSQLHSSSNYATHSFTFPPLLKACAKLCKPSYGQILHALLLKTGFQSDPFASTALTSMYASNHSYFSDALKVFDEMPHPNMASFNALLSGFSRNGCCGDALRVFRRIGLGSLGMNSVTVASLLLACEASNYVEQVHCLAMKLGVLADVYVATSLVTAYSNCEEIIFATKVFEGLLEKNVVSYNAFISGLLLNGVPRVVLDVFKDMIRREGLEHKPNSVTLASVLSACASLSCLRFGRQVHVLVVKFEAGGDEVMVGTALVDMYSKCGSWYSAFEVFNEMEGDRRNLITWNSMISGMLMNAQSELAVDMFQKLESEGLQPDSATWNTMISGLAQQGLCVEAFKYFRKMQFASVTPCLKTLTSLLSACADSSALMHGKGIHGHAIRADIDTDDFLATAVVDMYMKCGHTSWARRTFDQFDTKPDDPAFWNAMIGGYGTNGDYESAFEIFDEMLEEMVQPNSATFVSVLSACSHTGQVDRGLQVFKMMRKEYGFQPKPEHFGCMVDLLGRSGCLDEARDLVQELVEPPASVYASLLGACKSYLDSNLGEEMAMKLLGIEPENPAPLVVLSNIYAGLGRWREVERIRGMITDKGLDKLLGFSIIEVA
ncbi:hypothetical protein TanjilG_26671 [Lupinus angustifolius]|uniref:Pentacotripeptide-repeat region of PRORP domain-containing protein n=1 Tax=Lupinus angustifolius TaxID=3871 RepID=A0A394DD86_LUPAN|nr:PREDICTED: pentatricopeptide repeat-containing protein At2g02750 [Lupinus angustifolius]OIW20959.1 hypothetical protein TanjilG_26671 [Lupinus angustifolius]